MCFILELICMQYLHTYIILISNVSEVNDSIVFIASSY